MKKIILCSFATFLAFTFIPNETKAETGSVKTEVPINSSNVKNNLINRLTEIKAMDKSTLTRSEKRELCKVIQEKNGDHHVGPGGIYISVGALIVIILLLILFL